MVVTIRRSYYVLFNVQFLMVTVILAVLGYGKGLSIAMFIHYIINFLILTSTAHSFGLNGFKYLTQKMTAFVGFADMTKHQTRWIEQKLDHFDENDDRTWKMRYFRRRDLWKPTGPIYMFLGGEAEASPSFLYSGVAYELANETNGALYATEHRYYGRSIPVNGTEVKDLKYLSARQALADNAHLIRTIKTNPMFWGSKVVVIGGSYPGNLATWMRLLYPDLVDAAIASSAPVLAKKDFYEYLEKVSDDFERYGTEGCWNAINDRFRHYESMFATEEGIEGLKQDENICPGNNMSVPENRQLFFLSKASTYMSIAQYGNTAQIKDQCRTLNTTNNSSLFYESGLWPKQLRCINYDFNDMIYYYYKNQINDDVGWTYQTCTEFGYFQSTTSDNQPFTHNIPVDYYVKICTSAYGSQFNDTRIDRGIRNVNKMYGGMKPNVTKVVFVNGDLDPWSRLGILEDLSVDAPAIVIPRSSHCRDLYSNRDDDEKELKDARRNIKHYIKKWIHARRNITTAIFS